MGVRLVLSFGLLISIVVCLGLLGLKHVHADVELEKIIDTRQYKAQLSRDALDVSNLNNRITMQVFLIEDENEINSLLKQRAKNTEKISAQIETLRTKVESPEEAALLDTIDQNRIPYIESYRRALHLLVDEKKTVEARAVMVQEALPKLLNYHAAWNAYVRYQGDQLNQAQSATSTKIDRARIEAFSLISLASALSVFIAFFVTRNLTRHMARRKRAEEALRQAHDELETKVQERTSQLAVANNQLAKELDERKLIESSLRDSEARYRMLFESNPHPMWVFDVETFAFLAVNDVAVQRYGYSREEFLNMKIQDIRPIEDVSALLTNVANTQGAQDFAGVWRHRKKDGTLIDVEVTWHNLDFAGRPARLVLAHDITERKRAEEALSREQYLMRALMDNIPDAIFFKDPQGRFLRVNKALANKHKHGSPEEAVGKTDFDFFLKESAQPRYEQEQEIIRNGRPLVDVEEEEIWPDRPPTWSSTTKMPLRDEQGQIVGTFGVSRDITERKRMEDERQIISEIIQGAITTPDLDDFLMLVHHSIDKCIYAENCFVALYDEGTELMHFPFWVDKLDPCPPPRPVGIGFSSYVLRTGKPMLVGPELTEEMYRRGEIVKSGSASASWLGVPLRTPTRTIGVLVVQHYEKENIYDERDLEFLTSVGSQIALVIERKRAETNLRETEDQLRQSQKMESIGTLAGGIAHDFNNLMTAVTGYSELVLRHLEAGDPLRPKIEEIKKAGERAASLTRQLLAFSRKQILQPRVLDLNSVITGMCKMLTRVIGEDFDVKIELDASLGQVEADPGQVEQILLNLAVNARDAMPDGGYLTIKTENVYFDAKFSQRRSVVEPGHYVMLSVSDNGCGMDAETQTHIFEPFFTTKEVGKGTGLGLSTVYGIVKQSGGSIWVYSEVGRGSTFKIYLPRVDEVVEPEESADESRLASRGSETILLVEDEEMVRDLSKEILEDYGYAVITAPDGKEGLRICKEFEGHIDLMITDVVMPQMSGRQLAESIGALRPDTRVLYMSGFTDDAVVRHGVLDDGVCFIQKPFSPESLALKAREVLDQGGSPPPEGSTLLSLQA